LSDKLTATELRIKFGQTIGDVLAEKDRRIEALERALRVLLEHRSHCFIPEEAREFPHLHGWTESARALLTPSAAPERQ
jgi:hypothetical protein